MTNTLRHRGPDDEGYLIADLALSKKQVLGGRDTPDNVFASTLPYAPKLKIDSAVAGAQELQLAFGHRRLSIIDLSPAGHQPMCNKKGTLWVVYNGEIYNYPELRVELENHGYTFQSSSDTEVLLTAYDHWGTGALNRFVGMFAFAILDMPKKKVFLARDFFGIKPLYYSLLHKGFAFASEIKALLELPQVHRSVNPQRVYDYLRFSLTDQGEETLFSQVFQVPAAHYLELSLDNPKAIKSVRYWDVTDHHKSAVSFIEAAGAVRSLFLDSVKLHMRSDVPVGSALSGGIDSSSIVMAMRRLLGDAANLHTFSYIADRNDLSEERWVDLVGASSRAVLHKVRLDPQQLKERIDHLIYIQDEPFLSTSIFAQNSVFMLAHEMGVKVMLDGQGADEVFGGYYTHLVARLASLLKSRKPNYIFRFFVGSRRLPGVQRWNLFGQAGALLLPESLKNFMRRVAGRELTPGWLNLKWFAERDVLCQPSWTYECRDIFRQHLRQNMYETMLPMLLRYEDRNSMSFSIESRVPFLTPNIVNFLLSLPEEYLVSNDAINKAVFRYGMRGIVPDAVLERRDKVAFNTPEKVWLRTLRPFFDKVLNEGMICNVPALNQWAIGKDWPALLSGNKPFDGCAWRWINFILWAQRFSPAFD